MEASFADLTRLTETPTPIPSVVVLPTALPSESAAPSVLFDDESVNKPAAVTFPPSGTVAVALDFCRFTATAAATEILPSLEEAEGLLESALAVELFCLESPTSLSVCCFLPKVVCLLTL